MKQISKSVPALQFFKQKINQRFFWRKKIKEEKMEESFGTKTDTKT